MLSALQLSQNENNQKLFFTPQNFHYYSKQRIIQKNLVHFLGFPDSIFDENILSSKEYFGQFGKITKIMISSKNDEISKKKSNSAYITFSNKEEASYAILSVDSIIIEGNLVRAFFGTTKYCIHFLNNIECYNKDKCMFLHYFANKNDIINPNSKFGYSKHIKLAKKIINYGSFENINFIKNLNIPFNTYLPNVKFIYSKEDNFSNSSNSTKGNSTENLYKINYNNKNKNEIHKNVDFINFKKQLFKNQDKSRFFNLEYENERTKDKIEISEDLRYLIEQLIIRYPFFNQFEDLISFKKLSFDYCQDKLKNENKNFTLYINECYYTNFDLL